MNTNYNNRIKSSVRVNTHSLRIHGALAIVANTSELDSIVLKKYYMM